MKKQTKLVVALVLLILGTYFGYNYMYQDHRDIETEDAKITVQASELVTYFTNNKAEEVLNHTVQVSGKITEIDNQTLTIDDSVLCSFETAVEGLSIDDEITVKGRCIGFDDLFEIAKLDQSTIIN